MRIQKSFDVVSDKLEDLNYGNTNFSKLFLSILQNENFVAENPGSDILSLVLQNVKELIAKFAYINI